jgi:haloalkane dehalogenase
LIEHIPGAAGQPHARITGGHFVQEDCGPELAARILFWDQARR